MKPVKFLIDDENKMIFFYEDGHTEIIYLPTEDGMEQGVPSGLERHKYYSIGEKEFDILKENEKMDKDYLESLERLAMPDELHAEECRKLGIGLTEDFDVVEQALLELKSIKESKQKQYLKWEDLPFENMKMKGIFVRMNSSTYLLILTKYKNCENVRLQYTNGKECNQFLYLNASDVYAKQFFNDLKLEFVKEE